MRSFFDPSSRWYYPLRWLILIVLGLAVYARTFGYDFVFDDNYFVFNTHPVLLKTRLIGLYSFMLNYHLDQLDPRGYHIFNFAVHLIATGLVWACAALLFKIAGWDHRELPFFIALLFLVHPCQTQAVTYISQRFESMAAVFYLGSIYAYLRGRLSSSQKHQILFFMASAGLAILGVLTKETAATIPLMVLAAECILFKNNRREIIILLIGGSLFFILFMQLVRTDLGIFFHFHPTPSESHDGDIITAKSYVLTQMRVFLTFMRLLVLPIHQNLDYDYPLSKGLLHPPLTLVGACLIGRIIYSIFKLRKRYPVIAFGLAWILISFSINLAPRANVIFEHKLYLISFGFFLALVSLLSVLIRRREVLNNILIALVIVLSLLSFMRNRVWQNEFTLWSDAARESPHKARPYNSLGVIFAKQGNFTQAYVDFNKAIEINPEYSVAYNNRGNAYSKQGNYAQALSDLNKAIALNPDYAEAYTNRGYIYDSQGHFDQALSDYTKVIALDPDSADAYSDRGLIYGQQGFFFQAMSDLNKAITLSPENVAAYVNRGTFYAQQGKSTLALNDYDTAIDLKPEFGESYANRAVIFFQLGDYDKAWNDVYKAEELGANINQSFIKALKRVSQNK